MLLEFDADQQLWQDTVRDAVAKQCPANLVRGVAENKVDAAPLWGSYVDQGWTELVDPENAVELAIVLEELGRATDPTPYLATVTQFAPLAGDRGAALDVPRLVELAARKLDLGPADELYRAAAREGRQA